MRNNFEGASLIDCLSVLSLDEFLAFICLDETLIGMSKEIHVGNTISVKIPNDTMDIILCHFDLSSNYSGDKIRGGRSLSGARPGMARKMLFGSSITAP